MKQKKALILVVDDDNSHREMLESLLKAWGYRTQSASNGKKAIEAVGTTSFDLVLMDIRMLDVSGLEALPEIKKIEPALPVLLMTAYASIETAIAAMKAGAYDYLSKPLDFEKLRLLIERALELGFLKAENAALRRSLDARFDNVGIIGNSVPMRRLIETIALVAPTDATVLISGESGVGKELVAEALHRNSPRKNGEFIKINCAAIPENLLEAELFGHEKGAFTGADKMRIGRFEQANGGSLFLDEVSEMSLLMQAKLLRVLQEKEISRVGGNATIKVDVRLIAATNKDLAKMVSLGNFREDLFYRLHVIMLKVPPLREHREDIGIIAQHYLQHFSEKYKKGIKGFSASAFAEMGRREWKGNVRELLNTIERAVVLSHGEYIGSEALAPILGEEGQEAPPRIVGNLATNYTLKDVEREAIATMLKTVMGNKSEAARRLGVTRRTLQKKLQEYGLL